MPWLYAYRDLPDLWCEQRKFTAQILSGAIGGSGSLPTPQGDTDPVPTAQINMRFLVFGVLSAFTDVDVGPLMTGELVEVEADPDQDRAGVLAALEGWRNDCEETLKRLLPEVMSARFGTPATWQTAIHQGFSLRNLVALSMAAIPRGLTVPAPESLATTQAVMGFYDVGERLDLRIGIIRDGAFTEGVVWSCHQDLDTELHEAMETLLSLGVLEEHIHVTDFMGGDERCPDCGQPYFPSLGGIDVHAHHKEKDHKDISHERLP